MKLKSIISNVVSFAHKLFHDAKTNLDEIRAQVAVDERIRRFKTRRQRQSARRALDKASRIRGLKPWTAATHKGWLRGRKLKRTKADQKYVRRTYIQHLKRAAGRRLTPAEFASL